MSNKPDAIDELVDLVVHVPIGIMLAVRDQLPALAERGRKHAQQQTQLARMFGKFAVDRGIRYVRSRVPSSPSPTKTAPTVVSDVAQPTTTKTPPVKAMGPSSASFPIDGYDQLTAPAVIAQLPMLTADALRTVEAHERAGRGRRTILGKVSQLLDSQQSAAS